jgi:hypothetical protein
MRSIAGGTRDVPGEAGGSSVRGHVWICEIDAAIYGRDRHSTSAESAGKRLFDDVLALPLSRIGSGIGINFYLLINTLG